LTDIKFVSTNTYQCIYQTDIKYEIEVNTAVLIHNSGFLQSDRVLLGAWFLAFWRSAVLLFLKIFLIWLILVD